MAITYSNNHPNIYGYNPHTYYSWTEQAVKQIGASQQAPQSIPVPKPEPDNKKLLLLMEDV